VTVFSRTGAQCPEWLMARKIDRSLSIDDETALNPNRANFPLKSKAKKFDGLTVGFRPSAEKFCVLKSVSYDV
jgi:hypothetical protein